MIFFIIGPGYCTAYNYRDYYNCHFECDACHYEENIQKLCAFVRDENSRIYRLIYDGPNGDGRGVTRFDGSFPYVQYWTVYIRIYKGCFFTAWSEPNEKGSKETWSWRDVTKWHSYDEVTKTGWVGWWWQNDIRSFECRCFN